jgi:hypothetical protein
MNYTGLTCDACGEPIHSNPVIEEEVLHHACANPKIVNGIVIGYDSIVLDTITPEGLDPQDTDVHPPDCGCSWCVPLAWTLTPAGEY